MSINKELMEFLDVSHSHFHAVKLMEAKLKKAGYRKLHNDEVWELEDDKYFVVVNDSSIIAFDLSDYQKAAGFKIVASHTDAPTFKVKPSATKIVDNYIIVNTEAYGGLIDYTWLDRPLKLAGRVIVNEDGYLKSKFFNSQTAVGIIPSLAIHMNREVNKETKFNRHSEMRPILGQADNFDFKEYVAKSLKVNSVDIVDFDLYFKVIQAATYVGVNHEFVASNHLDNLQCAYVSLKAFIESENNSAINVFVSFDNEEVGSMSKQGAFSTILKDTIERINEARNLSKQEHLVSLAKSFIVSADNAHANHPNYPSFNDENHHVYLNGGVVLKYSGNQKYTTDALSASILLKLAKAKDIKIQSFVNRADRPGGSTLGAISTTQVSIKSVDIGLPQFAMHSSMELSGSQDSKYLYDLLHTYYSSEIIFNDNSIKIVNLR